MKKSIPFISFVIFSLLTTFSSRADCGDRFKYEVFSSVKISTETYSDVYNLKVDIYEPEGDTWSERPLVILAFGGSFITGSRVADPTIVALCNALAKRGYVAASIDYRLATNPVLMLDSAYAINTVVKAVSDGKAAIRYFIKDAATVNKYRIDVDNIFTGGNSAGGVLYLHAGYLSSLEEAEGGLADAIAANGGMEGNSGNAGYSYTLKGIISMAGGLHRANFVSADDVPAIFFHGDADNTVPYYCGPTMSGYFVSLCGYGSLQPELITDAVAYEGHVYEGKGHCPWNADPIVYLDLQTKLVNYLYNRVSEDTPTGIEEGLAKFEIQLYPNPNKGLLFVESKEPFSSISIKNNLGQQVYEQNFLPSLKNCSVSTAFLSSGLYFVILKDNKNQIVRKLRIEK